MRTRSKIMIGLGAAGAVAAGAGIVAAFDDPDVYIQSRTADGVVLDADTASSPRTAADTGDAAATTPVTEAPAGADTPTPVDTSDATTSAPTDSVAVQFVEGLEPLVGILVRDDDDIDDWYVAGVDVDFGPERWLVSAIAPHDFDGDGRIGTMFEEIDGLVGTEVTLGVRFEYDDDRDDADVYTIQGLTLREPAGGQAPWQTTPSAGGTSAGSGGDASFDTIGAAALAAVGPGSTVLDIDVERDIDGWDVWVQAADGRQYDVYVDRAGNVVDIRLD